MPARSSRAGSTHILTDTNGLLVAATVHAAGMQDRDGAAPLLAAIRHPFPLRWHLHAVVPRCGPDRRRWRRWLRHVFADGGHTGAKLETALAALGTWTLKIGKRADIAKGFELLPRRWVVERTLAWLNRNRRLAKDFEALLETATTWLLLASVKLLSRGLARDNQPTGYRVRALRSKGRGRSYGQRVLTRSPLRSPEPLRAVGAGLATRPRADLGSSW